jgi:hypothetical protein
VLDLAQNVQQSIGRPAAVTEPEPQPAP